MYLFVGVTSGNRLCLVDPASIGENPLLFFWVVGLMIQGQVAAKVASIITHDGSTVTHVDDEHAFLDKESDDGA